MIFRKLYQKICSLLRYPQGEGSASNISSRTLGYACPDRPRMKHKLQNLESSPFCTAGEQVVAESVLFDRKAPQGNGGVSLRCKAAVVSRRGSREPGEGPNLAFDLTPHWLPIKYLLVPRYTNIFFIAEIIQNLPRTASLTSKHLTMLTVEWLPTLPDWSDYSDESSNTNRIRFYRGSNACRRQE